MFKIKDTTVGWHQLFYLGILAIACFKIVYAAPQVWDILFYDESIYLHQGLNFNWGMIFKDGFVYRLWYLLLSLIAGDAVNLYYVNYILLIWLNPFLIYFVLRKLQIERFYCSLFGLLFLISNVNVTSWPFITRFALALILGTLILMMRAQTMKSKFYIVLGGLFLLVYTRPEYILSWLLFSLIAVMYLIFRYLKTRKQVMLVAVMVTVICSGFIFIIKSPAQTRRSMMAFGQHYALNLYKQGKITINPNTNWKKILKEDFQTDDSLMSAFMSNPKAMVNHMIANVKVIPYQMMQHFFPFGIRTGFIKKALLVILCLLFVLQMVFVFVKKWKQKSLWGEDKNEAIFDLISLIIMLPLLISIVFIYPREHYLLILMALICMLAAKHIPPLSDKMVPVPLKYAVMVIILFFIPWYATSTIGLMPGKVDNIHNKQCTNLRRIAVIRSIVANPVYKFKTDSPPRLLSAGGSMEPYVHGLQHVSEQAKKGPFMEFMAQENINMILLNPGLMNDNRFAGDKEFKEFVASLPNDHWRRIKLPGCNESLAVKTGR